MRLCRIQRVFNSEFFHFACAVTAKNFWHAIFFNRVNFHKSKCFIQVNVLTNPATGLSTTFTQCRSQARINGEGFQDSPCKTLVEKLYAQKRTADQNEMALSPRQPFNGRRVLRIPGFGLINWINDHWNDTRTIKQRHFNIATMNLSTMKGEEEEICEVIRERKIAIMGLCETRCKGKIDK